MMPYFQLVASWLTERKLVAILLIIGETWLLTWLILWDRQVSANIVQLISVGVGGFTTAIGIMAQAIWHAGVGEAKPTNDNDEKDVSKPDEGSTSASG